MGLTLVEASKLNSGNVLKSTVMEMFAKANQLLLGFPFENIPGGAVEYNQEGVLPGVAFRGYNEAYVASAGVINPKVDSVKIAGGDLDVDVAIVKTRGAGVRAAHVAMKIKALADLIAYTFIKGDNSTNPREFDGLQARVSGAQKIANGATSGGDVLSIAKLDEAIDQTDNPTHILMNRATRRAMGTFMKNSSTIQTERDAYGRPITLYNDLPILASNLGSTESLPFTEANPGGGTAASTSIYVVSFGANMLTGIQNGEMEVRDLGELDTIPVLRMRIEWLMGLADYHGRAVTRLHGIKTGTAVA